MRLDHLLSKEEEVKIVSLFSYQRDLRVEERAGRDNRKVSGGDADRGNTRTHPEHEG